jgi:hypothetical protein
MEKPHFVETGSSSFFGEYLYDQVVPQDHFLRQLKRIIEWERFTRKLLKLYKGGGVVRRPALKASHSISAHRAETYSGISDSRPA